RRARSATSTTPRSPRGCGPPRRSCPRTTHVASVTPYGLRVASCNPERDAALHDATCGAGAARRPCALARVRGDGDRRLHGGARPLDRERRLPLDPPVVPRRLAGDAL